MDIGEVAKRSGLTPATLRYYEQIGLIQSNGRNGLRRTFDKGVIQQLELIILLKNNLFSLKEIQHMTAMDSVDRQFLRNKAHEIARKVKTLTAICDTLTHIANCPERDHFDCPSFQKLLEKKSKSSI